MDTFRKLFRFPPVPIFFISGICFLAITGLRNTGALEHIELTVYDFLVRSRPSITGIDKRIVIIRIDEKDIVLQKQWPLTDNTLSKVLKAVLVHQPIAVGLDIFRDISVPPGSAELNRLLIENPNVICVTKFGKGGVPGPPVLHETNRVGFNDILVDPGGVTRRGLLFLDNGDRVVYSFNLILALHYLKTRGIFARPDRENPDVLKLGQTTIPPFKKNDGGYVNADVRGYQFLIDYKDGEDFYQSFSLTETLNGKIDPDKIRDKIVIVGAVAQSVKDIFYTPFSRGFLSGQHMHGLILHARLANQLIRFGLGESTPVQTLQERTEIFLILFWSILGGTAGFFNRSPFRQTIVLTTGTAVLFMISCFAFLHDLWIPLVPPVMTFFLSSTMLTALASGMEKKQKAVLMQLFSKHVSSEIASDIWNNRDDFLYKGKPRPRKMAASILFSDIKGFSRISETLDPDILMEWLNNYMEAMTDIIISYGGVVDDYAGDGIKANFGVPLPRNSQDEIAKDAVNAVTCAIEMGREMIRLNTIWKGRGFPEAGTRIGIHTGPVVAGVLGSAQRMKYTTVGDNVNIAARLESYDKNLGADQPWRILIGETTYNHLPGRLFNTRFVTKADLKGINKKVSIYRVFSRTDLSVPPETKEVIP